MKARQPAACLVMLSLVASGCGVSADQAVPAGIPPASSAASRESATKAVKPVAAVAEIDNPAPTTPGPILPAAATTPVTQPTEPPPTAEQIARWTPPPFEPLQLLAVRESKDTSFTSQLAAVSDGSHFLVAGSRVLLWSLSGDEPEHVFLDRDGANANRQLGALAVAADGRWFAVGDSEGTLRVWSLEDRQLLASKQLYRSGIQHIAISPDASEIATITYDSVVTIWTPDQLERQQSFKLTTSGVKRVEYVGPQLLAAAGESTALWNTGTGAKVHDLPAGRYNDALASTSDGARFIFGAEDSLRVWNVAAAEPAATVFRGVSGRVRLTVSHDGKYLATSDGRSVDVWSLSDGRRLQSIPGFGWTIVGVRWLPTTNLLAVASDVGVTRIWGTPGHGDAAGLKPLQAPVAMPTETSRMPETPAQLAQILDWRTFPAFPASTVRAHGATDLAGVAPVGIPEARAFYRYFLTQAGWDELPQDPNNPTSLKFRKGAAEISGYFYDAGEGSTNISLHLAGRYDARWAPKADAAAIEIVYEDANSSSYRARASILHIESSLLRKFHEAGWAAYARLNSSTNEAPDRRDLEFMRNGATLHVSVGKFPDDTVDTYTVQHSLFANHTWVPVPPDAGFVEFDGSTEPELIAMTKMSLPEAREFYDRELTADGWLARSSGRSLKEEQYWLAYLRGQCNVSVSLTKLPDQRTLVRIGNASGSIWELSLPKEGEDEAPTGGLEAADFPLRNSSATGKFDPLHKTIEVRFDDSTLAKVAEIYTKALGELGWEADKGGIRDEEYTSFKFTKDAQEISLRARKQDGVAVVSFEGDGLRWNKELPGGKQVVSYPTWLRLSKRPPSLEFLERYEAEMQANTAN